MQTRQWVYPAKVKESPFLEFTLLNVLERRCVHWLGRWVCMRLANPVLTSGVDLFPVFSDSTLPRFVKSLTGCLLPVRILNHVSV